MKLVFATNNAHKLSELRQIAGGEIEIVGLGDIGCHDDIPETGATIQENALQKARYVNQKYGLDCFADDTGLEVDALSGAPGVYSARWAAMEKGQPSCTPDENVQLMLQRMQGVDDRHACFRTCIALIQGGEERLFDGRVDGEITRERSGAEGFGYDPIFRPDGWDITFAQASPEQKNAISHRGRATAKLMAWLRALTCAVLALVGLGATAAEADGWHKYPIWADGIDDVVEAADGKAYFLSGQSLYSFIPADEELYAYTHINRLNDNEIASIHYNRQGRYLLIAYANGNIDLLYDDGHVANLPDIRLSQVTGSKRINSVAFGDGRIAIGTDFGLVVFDDQRLEVIESGIYNTPVFAVAIANGRIYLEHQEPGKSARCVVFAPLDQRHYSLEKFSRLGGWFTRQIVPIDENTILLVGWADGKLTYREVDHENSTWRTSLATDRCIATPLRPCANGLYATDADGNILTVNGKDITTVTVPAELRAERLAIGHGPDRLWAGSASGLSCVDISGAAPAVVYGKMLPQGAITCGKVGYLRHSPDGERLYVSNLELSMYKPFATVECGDAYQTTNIIERGFPRDASLFAASADHDKSREWQAAHGNSRMYGDPAWVVEDPDNPGRYYCANNHEGVYVLQYNAQTKQYDEVAKFTSANSPIANDWGSRAQDVNIDPEGNLWVGYIGGYAVLPAAKRRGDLKSITAADWRAHAKLAQLGSLTGKDMMSLFCRSSQMAFMFTALWQGGLTAVDTKGTYANPSDDVVYRWTRFTDQDGNTFEVPDRITFAIEDSRGAVWLGTSAGIIEITNPNTATNADMRVRRPKVPRNDGTNYADYLLESEIVNWICIDPAGRKWVATQNSGLFLVSAAGDRIIRQINADNSPLLSNQVSAVECDPATNTVYVGTPDGLYTFLGDASAPQDDFSQILAYPNPVRPEYTGAVTIAGLMDHSVVKIADAAGNVIWQTRAQGGMASWDPVGSDGQRVRSGIYYAYVTSDGGDSGSTAGTVVKIMVIN